MINVLKSRLGRPSILATLLNYLNLVQKENDAEAKNEFNETQMIINARE